MKPIAQDNKLKIIRIETAPHGANAYAVICRKTGESVLIDAPAQAHKIIEALDGTTPRYILITHNHFDHLGALVELNSILKIPIGAHPADSKKMVVSSDIMLNDGDRISFGEIALKVLHTPGHTPGSLCFLTDQYLFSGDTLFPGGPGRTGSPETFVQIVRTISKKIMVLPGETQVYPGHGPSTQLKREQADFNIFNIKKHPPTLCGDVLWLSS